MDAALSLGLTIGLLIGAPVGFAVAFLVGSEIRTLVAAFRRDVAPFLVAEPPTVPPANRNEPQP